MKGTYRSSEGLSVLPALIGQELYRTKSVSIAMNVHEMGPSLITSSPIKSKVSKYKEKTAVSPKTIYYRM